MQRPQTPASLEFLTATQYLMSENNLMFPHCIEDAINLYVHLVALFKDEI